MASTFSPSLRLELIGDGDQSGIWGQTTNNNLGGLIEQAIGGVVTISMVDANYTLSNFNGVVDEARNAVIVATGALSAQRNIIAPLVEKTYAIQNNTTGGFAVQIIGPSGTGVIVPNGSTVLVYCNGTNYLPLNTGSAGNFRVAGNLTVTGTTALTGALTASTATFSGAITSVSPAFSGVPTAPTASAGTNNTQIATTAFATAAAFAAFPSGGIIMWSGSIASIPLGWLLCNGTSGTPDLRDRFIVGAGSTYAVNATGGFATYSLSTAQLPSHTHSISASGTTSTADVNHTHSGVTDAANVDHSHGINIQSGAMSANNTHSHSIADPGHSHAFSTNPASPGVLFTQGQSGYAPQAGFTGGAPAVQVNPFVQTNTTGITGTNTVDINHSHNVSGNTGGQSTNHVHSFTSGFMNQNNTHAHTVTVTGTSGATGSGASIDNRPPYFALAYIMKA
jgi:microcystin-dependent protein